jgi:hypothetical protein
MLHDNFRNYYCLVDPIYILQRMGSVFRTSDANLLLKTEDFFIEGKRDGAI